MKRLSSRGAKRKWEEVSEEKEEEWRERTTQYPPRSPSATSLSATPISASVPVAVRPFQPATSVYRLIPKTGDDFPYSCTPLLDNLVMLVRRK